MDIDGKVVLVSADNSHTAAVTKDGGVFAWGTFRLDPPPPPSILSMGEGRHSSDMVPVLRIRIRVNELGVCLHVKTVTQIQILI